MIIISNNGESLPIAYRVLLEGTPVEIYVHNPKSRGKNYRGILPRLDVSGLYKALKKHDTVIFDLTHPNGNTQWDIELLQMVGLKSKEISKDVYKPNSVFGPVADKLMKSHKVIGCSSWSEDIELDRVLGAQIAQKIGLDIPPAQEFSDLKSGLKFLESDEGGKSLWVLKPFNNQDLDLTYVESYSGELAEKFKNELPRRVNESTFHHMLQEKIDGTEISTEIWFTGDKVVTHNRTVEDKKLMCGGLSVQIGSQSNTVFLSNNTDGPIFSQLVKGLPPILRSVGYKGPIDANCIIKGDKNYFLEWSARLGYDAIYCLLSLLPDKSISRFFLNDFHLKNPIAKFACSSRITIPPFPYKDPRDLKEKAAKVPIAHKLEELVSMNFWPEDIYYDRTTDTLRCGGRDGIIGVMTATGSTVDQAAGRVLKKCKDLRVGASKQYRIDLADRANKVLKEIGELL